MNTYMQTRPIVVVVASRKGGVGKSTICLNLALAAEGEGFGPVALYDVDPQESISQWYAEREPERPILLPGGAHQLAQAIEQAQRAEVKLIIVDTPPSVAVATEAVLSLADYVIIPTQDGRPDLRAAAASVDLVESLGKPFTFALTFVRGSVQAAEATKVLSARGPVAAHITNRMAVKTAWNRASAITEASPTSPAAAEFFELWHFVAERIGFIPSKAKKRPTVQKAKTHGEAN